MVVWGIHTTMATETRTATGISTVSSSEWVAGAVGGLVGSVFFGLMMQFAMPPPLPEMAIPPMYGIEGPALAAGWALHLFHGVVLGFAYVALVQFEPFRDPARRLGGSLALGVGYGVLTTALLAVLVMPIWLSAVGFPAAPPFPNVAIPGTVLSLVGHVVHAIPVAVGHALVSRKLQPAASNRRTSRVPCGRAPGERRSSERRPSTSI
ncbi:hypothetical protein [Halorarum salinum]|uniref:hypothetical protein n=1 Tax=Halorarum salinum TaxID=2743089 RepID=UPI002AA2A9D0|nr:hypothetical protein [Halobaculum salinum]